MFFEFFFLLKVTVTDPDHIEKSNLNRQFLFRHDDIGHAKAERATIAAQRMHPAMRVKVNLDKVGAESEHIYDNKVCFTYLQTTKTIVV